MGYVEITGHVVDAALLRIRAVRDLCYPLMESPTTLQRDGQMDGVRACGTAEWICDFTG